MIQREGPLQNFSEYTPGFAIAGALIFIAALPDRRWGDEAISVGIQCLVGERFESTARLDYVERCLFDERR
jgi:hypothetical protein